MKARIIFSIIAFAIGGGLLASCHHNRKRTVIHRTVIVQKAASPSSMSGRTITFDYSHAEHRELVEECVSCVGGGYKMIYLTHVPWNKYDPNYNKKHYPHGYLLANYYALPRIKFKGNEYKCNVRLNESFSPVFHYTYRKSGENTAIIHCSGHDGGCQYFLTFETPRSGTAVFEAVNAADKEELRGIRFSIK